MKFYLLDKIESISPASIVAVKQVTLAEEYLADHFPTFPVLPGVMMLEAATQACGWVLHCRSDFARPMAVLKEARNVKYGHFVAPGRVLRVRAELTKESPTGGTFKVEATVHPASGGGTGGAGGQPADAKTAFTARLEIAYFALGEKNPALAALDADLVAHARARYALVAPAPGVVAM